MLIPGFLRVSVVRLLCAAAILSSHDAFAATTRVAAGGDLQAAINAARPGDTIVLDAGATYIGNFVLPVKSGSAFITIRSAENPNLPAAGVRVSPKHAFLLAKIRSNNSAAAILTAPGAHHWRLELLELPSNFEGYGDILQIGDGSHAQNLPSEVPYTIELDRLYIHGHPVMGQKRGVALNAADVTIRNCHISDIKAVGFDTQAIGGWNGPGPFVIENNYLEASGENLLLGGSDPGVPNLVSEDVVFRRNHVTRPLSWRNPIVPTPTNTSATAVNGGTLPAGLYTYRIIARQRVGAGSIAQSTATSDVSAKVAGGATGSVRLTWAAVPGAFEYVVYGRTAGGGTQNWTATGTSLTDTGASGRGGGAPTSIGDRWLVKNLFELKNARNVLVENNVFENNWSHGQAGYAILFTPRNQDGGCPWCVVENVTFQFNIVKNSGGGINILGYDDINPSRQTANIRIANNLFYGIEWAYGGSAWFLLMGGEPKNIVVEHNTVDAEGSAAVYVYGGSATSPAAVYGFQFTNNAIRHNDYGINGTEFSYGTGILTKYFPDSVVRGNWLQGGYSNRYPAGNYFDGVFASGFRNISASDYTPSSGGVLVGQATDGGDIGADIAALLKVTALALDGRVAGPQRPANVRIAVK